MIPFRLMECIVNSGYDLDEFADSLGFNTETVIRWMHGGIFVHTDVITKIAQLSWVSTDYLVGLRDDQEIKNRLGILTRSNLNERLNQAFKESKCSGVSSFSNLLKVGTKCVQHVLLDKATFTEFSAVQSAISLNVSLDWLLGLSKEKDRLSTRTIGDIYYSKAVSTKYNGRN